MLVRALPIGGKNPCYRFSMPIRIALLLALPVLASATPNIVFLVADDLGWNDVGYHGSEIQTPNIDAIAESGVRLERHYSYPWCSPTRAALMTGRSPLEIGVHGPFSPNHGRGLPTDEHLLPQSFAAADYQTFATGKWHLGNAHVKYFPHNRGFDRFYGHTSPGIDYFRHTAAGAYDWQRNGKSARDEGYSTSLIGNEAVRAILERDTDRPFLLYVAFNAPHTPLQAPQEYVEKYAHIEKESRRVFAAMVDCMDTAIGRILGTIESEGLARDTLVVFISDNGGLLATDGGADNSPLKGEKTQTWEGGIRTPAAVHWPGVVEGGEVVDDLITVHDWFPTLLDATGVRGLNQKPFYGQSVWSAIRDREPLGERTVVLGATGWFAVFDGPWKLVHRPLANGQTERTLYRIFEDPSESRDLAASEPAAFERLAGILDGFSLGETISGPAPGDERRPDGSRRPPPGNGLPGNPHPTQGPETRPPFAERASRD